MPGIRFMIPLQWESAPIGPAAGRLVRSEPEGPDLPGALQRRTPMIVSHADWWRTAEGEDDDS